MSHTYSVLDISEAAYAEIKTKLEAAGYQHAFDGEGDDQVIDMHGIAVKVERELPLRPIHESLMDGKKRFSVACLVMGHHVLCQGCSCECHAKEKTSVQG